MAKDANSPFFPPIDQTSLDLIGGLTAVAAFHPSKDPPGPDALRQSSATTAAAIALHFGPGSASAGRRRQPAAAPIAAGHQVWRRTAGGGIRRRETGGRCHGNAEGGIFLFRSLK